MADDEQMQPRVVLERSFYRRMELLCPGSLSRPEMLRHYLNLGYIQQLAVLGARSPADVASMEVSIASNLNDDEEGSQEWARKLIRTLSEAHNLDVEIGDDSDD